MISLRSMTTDQACAHRSRVRWCISFLRKSNEYAVADWPRTSEIALSSEN